MKDLCITPRENIFDSFQTEYKILNYLENQDLFQKPKNFDINRQISEVTRSYESKLEEEKITGTLLPISFQLRKYLEAKGVFETCIKNLKELQSNKNFSNIVNGEVWQKKQEQFQNKILFPICLYFDDCGINNPLRTLRTIH